jgi:hypothetical protein
MAVLIYLLCENNQAAGSNRILHQIVMCWQAKIAPGSCSTALTGLAAGLQALHWGSKNSQTPGGRD